MATQITTSTASNATAPSAAPIVAFAPSDNSAIVLFHNGSAPKLATAQAPYASWSTQTIGGATARHMLALRVYADDSLDVMVCSPSNDAFYFHYSRSGNTWTSDGNFNVVSGAGDSIGTAQAAQFHPDPQGRLWWVASDQTLATRTLYVDSATAPLSSWTHRLNVTITGVYPGLPWSAIIGNYLVVVYQDGAGGLKYQRLDVSGASLGSWSTAAAISGVSDIATTVQGDLCGVPGGATGILVYASNGNGIKSYLYDASADTWTASDTLSAATSDRQPCLVAGGSGVVYALWSQFVSGSNYALVAKAYDGSGWDASATTLEVSAAGQSWPNAAYLASSDELALLFTNATASPFGVEFEMVAAPATGGGGTVNGSGTLPANAALVESGAQLTNPSALIQANAAIAETAAQLVANDALLASESGLVVTGHIVAAGDTLAANAALSIAAQIVNPDATLQADSALLVTGHVQTPPPILQANSALVLSGAELVNQDAPLAAESAATSRAQIVLLAAAFVAESILSATGTSRGQSVPGIVTLSDRARFTIVLSDRALGRVTLSDRPVTP